MIILVGIILIPSAFAENVPNWVKNTAGWWAEDAISETEFVNAIEFLANEEIITVSSSSASKSNESVPDWVKNTAGWWAEDAISETEFVNAIEFLVKNGIINVSKVSDSESYGPFKLEKCMFEDNEYTHLSNKDRELLCTDFNFNFVTERTNPSKITATYNSEGFRGSEFLKDKPNSTYRIFVIGGSTTFGDRNPDDETWPHYLHEIFDKLDLNYDVEIINAGFSSGWSGTETKLIREKILDYDPDLLMVYDGWNDIRMQLGEPQGRIAKPDMANPTLWKDAWIESCELTNTKNVKTIVTLQPFLGTGTRILSDQEQASYVSHSYLVNNDTREYTKYQKQLKDISKHCTDAVDLTSIFDQVDKPIYWDLGHVGSEGNKIIATHFFKLALPHIPGNEKIITSKIINLFLEESSIKSQQIPSELDLRGKNFVNQDFTKQDLRESIFHISNFKNTDFSYAELENTDFGFTLINGGNFNGADLRNALFSRATINFSDFSSADLTNVNLSTTVIGHTNLTNANLSDSNFLGAVLYNINFDNVNLENSVFDNSLIIHSDMKNVNKIKNLEIRFTDIYNVDFNGMDFSEMVFGPQNAFAGCDFRNSNLPTVQIGETDFSMKSMQGNDGKQEFFGGSNLSNLDFSNTDMSGIVFSHETTFDDNFQNIEFKDEIRNLYSVDLTESNLTGANLADKNLALVILHGTDLSNANLSNADLRYADLRNANLSDADLTNANLEFADLQGAILDNTILKCVNHTICLNK